jgi:hypothetical protein
MPKKKKSTFPKTLSTALLYDHHHHSHHHHRSGSSDSTGLKSALGREADRGYHRCSPCKTPSPAARKQEEEEEEEEEEKRPV